MGAEDRKAMSHSCGRLGLEAGMSGAHTCWLRCVLYVCNGPVCAGEVNEGVCSGHG